MTDLRACGDCGVLPGQSHVDGCDVARCLWTGGQALQCDNPWGLAELLAFIELRGWQHEYPQLARYVDQVRKYFGDGVHDCGHDVWTGVWPGVPECQELDLWCYWGPDYGEKGWVVCTADHPGAREDLNRLPLVGRWDRDQRWWVAR